MAEQDRPNTTAILAENAGNEATHERGSSIERTLELMHRIATAESALTPTQINEQLGWPKASVHRLCKTLEAKGFLRRLTNSKKLVPGPRLNELAMGVLSGSVHKTVRHAILQKLAADVGETCNISLPDGNAMIYFDRVESHWPLRMQFNVGSRVPLHCTAGGKLYLSSLPAAKRKQLLSQLDLVKYTDNTLVKVSSIEKNLNKIRKEQSGVDDEEFIPGMIAVSVPIKNSAGKMFAGLALQAPSSRMSLEQGKTYVPRLREAAGLLSRSFTE
ncbi:MAG: IclR family transcriptional regulator [Arenicellales bacterium WSBS_2016_MAG_OTU3]